MSEKYHLFSCKIDSATMHVVDFAKGHVGFLLNLTCDVSSSQKEKNGLMFPFREE